LDRLALADAVGSLPRDLRAVFVLKEIEGYSHDEIASLLGITPGNSEVRLFRARRRLRAQLGG
jgi:RNA polymerase sigma-70 factor, ECF subfamily